MAEAEGPASRAELVAELARLDAALAAQDALRSSLPGEAVETIVQALEAQRAAAAARLAAVEEPGRAKKGKGRGARSVRASRGGAAAQGRGAAAAGPKGVAIADSSGVSVTVVHGEKRRKAPSREAAYLGWLFEHLWKLSLSAVDPAAATEGKEAAARLKLDAVYTALLTRGQEEPSLEGAPHHGPRWEPGQAKPLSALAQLDRHPRLVLLGDPGSGKSTFVSFVALCLAGERLKREEAGLKLLRAPVPPERPWEEPKEEKPQPWGHGALLPVRVVLRDFCARGLPPVGEEATAKHLWEFLAAELGKAALAEFVPELEATLQGGGGLVLLDGLDEVPEADARRRQLCGAVEDFVARFSRCRFLVTSRTYAYQQQDWRLAGFTEAVLAPFGRGQVARFVDRWYAHLAALGRFEMDDATGRAALLKRAIEGSDRLRELAERPLLLTLMASLHAWRGGTLPQRRERLYADAVELLLDLWEQRRYEVDPDGKPLLTQPSLTEWLKVEKRDVRPILDELAFDVHAGQAEGERTADIPEGELVGRLMRLGGRRAEVNPRLLVDYLRDRAGLLEPRGVGVYTFPHRTFQEYLAACHLTGDDFPEKLAGLARSDPGRWREVVLLAAAKAAEGARSNAWQVAGHLCPAAVGEPGTTVEDAWGAHLAGQVLVEVLTPAELGTPGRAHAPILGHVRAWLTALLRRPDLPARERALAGETLAAIGDPRPEVMTVDGMEFCWVPAGPFRMGSEKGEEDSYDDERPAGEVEMPYGYWIGRYPVTVAQWREYVEAAELKVDDRGGSGGTANAPVASVNWHEASAFCAWATERWSQEGLLGKGWRVRLPSEAEWEKAARGGLGVPGEVTVQSVSKELGREIEVELRANPQARRRYPWGGETFDAECANAAAGIGRASTVGCFPGGSGPFGAEELSGNVWEWTRNVWTPYPYPAPGAKRMGRETPVGDSPRVLRGGSFLYVPGGARCACRGGAPPGNRLVGIGFRVVVLPPFSDL